MKYLFSLLFLMPAITYSMNEDSQKQIVEYQKQIMRKKDKIIKSFAAMEILIEEANIKDTESIKKQIKVLRKEFQEKLNPQFEEFDKKLNEISGNESSKNKKTHNLLVKAFNDATVAKYELDNAFIALTCIGNEKMNKKIVKVVEPLRNSVEIVKFGGLFETLNAEFPEENENSDSE